MRYLSLFSGLGGAELAFAPLGWECVAVSEIDPAACRVLSYRYPSIPNLGDITAVTEEQITALGKIDLVIFGFPCQDLSVAGKRAGLKDKDGENTRSGLFFDAMRIVRWSGARWAVAENVPGLFSSEEGRDFATVVGEMAGVRVDVPDGGWSNSGFLASATGIVEWAVLDAQFFRIPQRRRRVFLVRDIGDWTNRQPLLLERESLQGNPAPRREKGQRVAGTIKGGSGERGWPDPSDGNGGGLVDVAGTIGGGSGERGWQQHDGAGAFVPFTTNSHGSYDEGIGTLRSNGGDIGGGSETLISHAVTCHHAKGGDPTTDNYVVTGGFFDLPIGTMACNTGPNGHDAGNFQSNQGVDSGYVIPVAEPMCIKGAAIGRKPEAGPQYGEVLTDGSSYTLNASETHGVLAFTQNSREEVRVIGEKGDTAGSLSAEPGTHQTTYLAYRTNAAGQVDPQGDLSAALTSNTDPCTQILAFDTTQVTSKTNRSNPQVGDPCHTLAKGAEPPSIAYRIHGENSTAMTGDGIARVADPVDVARSLDTCGGYATNQGGNVVKQSMQVRRLTPVECERLQGIPDDHLTVLYNGKPLADGPKYRLCGNSFAVPCVAWIGKRIQMVEDMK